MSCEEFQELITRYVDDELTPQDRHRLEDHLRACESCKRRLADLAHLKEKLTMIRFKEPSDVELQRYWSRIYNRLERGLGWILFSLGAILLLCYGGFRLIEELVKDPDIALILKVGVVALLFGAVILFVSLLRERLTVRKTDRYSKEIER
jgi:anti-sigma factor RsiW